MLTRNLTKMCDIALFYFSLRQYCRKKQYVRTYVKELGIRTFNDLHGSVNIFLSNQTFEYNYVYWSVCRLTFVRHYVPIFLLVCKYIRIINVSNY